MFSSLLSKVTKEVTNLFEIFDSFQEGSAVFQTGQNVLQIMTRREPKSVWLSLVSTGEMAVCQGGLDQFSYTMTPNGFILYADVVSESAQLNWVAYF